MKTSYIFLLMLLYAANMQLSAQCTASFISAYPSCCPNTWQFTDTSQVSSGDSIISWYWDLTGGTPSYATIQNPFTTYPAIGVYTACLTIVTFDGCTDSSCQTILVTALSVSESDKMPAVTISPNPFSTQAVIQIASLLHNASLSIYNSYGQRVVVIEHLTEHNVILRRDHLLSGIYFVQLSANTDTYTSKLIVCDR